jgi:hypothetical protein
MGRKEASFLLEFTATPTSWAIPDKNLSVTLNGDSKVHALRPHHPIDGGVLALITFFAKGGRGPSQRTGIRIRASSIVRASCRTSIVSVVMLGVVTVASPVASSAVPTSNVGARSVPHLDESRAGAQKAATFAARQAVAGTFTVVRSRSRTHNGASGATPAPPAQRYQGLSICTDASGLKVAQGRTEVVSGSAYTTIIFVNEGPSNCYLNGTPFTQPVGAAYTPVGPRAAAYFDPSRGGYVVLDAGGGTASTSLGMANTAKYYPRASCAPRKVIGVTLRFSYPADFFFRFAAGPFSVCQRITTTSITGVARGVIEGP